MTGPQPRVPDESAVIAFLAPLRGNDQIKQRRTLMVSLLLIVGEILFGLGLIVALSADPGATSQAYFTPLLVAVFVLPVIFIINRSGWNTIAGTLLSLVVLGIAVVVLSAGEPNSANALLLAIPILLAALTGPAFVALALSVVAVAALAYLNVQADPNYVSPFVSGDFLDDVLPYFNLLLTGVVGEIFSLIIRSSVIESEVQSQALAVQQVELESQLTVQMHMLNASASIARAITGGRDVDEIMSNAVNLIRENFGYYHVQVFLVDANNEYAILRQSTGDAGRELLARAHRLAVGSLSVIGQVTSTGRSVLARDTDTDIVHRRNELLPLTRSEMALPLIASDRVIGALDLQSVEPDAFEEGVAHILQSMADQLAVAIENARLISQTQQSLTELEELYSDVTRQAWTEFVTVSREGELQQSYGPTDDEIEAARTLIAQRVRQTGTAVISTGQDGEAPMLAVPVVVRNQIIGVVGVEPEGIRQWTQDDLQMIQSIAERAALAVENTRLYIDAQRTAQREQMVNTIAGRLQRAPNLSTLLEAAAEELSRALGTENVYAEINLDHVPEQTAPDQLAIERTVRETAPSEPTESLIEAEAIPADADQGSE